MKIRKAAMLLLMLVTVLSPIVLYTETLGTNSYSGNDFIAEETSMFDSVDSSSATDNARIKRQLAEEAMEKHDTSISGLSSSRRRDSQSGGGGNLIRQVTGTVLNVHQDGVDSKKSQSNGEMEIKALPKDRTSKISDDQILKSSSSSSDKKIEQPLNSGRSSVRNKVDNPIIKLSKHVALPDILVRQLKDQLIRGRVYLSLSATKNNPHFIRELRLRIKEVTRALGDATKDSELPKNALSQSKSIEQTLAKGKQIQDDCSAVVKKLRAMLHSAEEQLRVHKKQTLFLSHLTAKTLPKGLHCLPLRLSTEYYMLNTSQQQFPYEDRFEDSRLYHYAIFSDNILAAAVVVSSTVSNAKDASKHVFHIVTDRLNYAAMKMWFLTNPPRNASIQVQSVEEFTWLNSSYSPVLKQIGSPNMINFYFKARRGGSSDPNLKFRNPKYLSILNHLRFYLPEIFPKLDKVLFLDDDVVVQKDLTGLWSIDLKSKIISVVETCGESFHRFDRYLNFSNPIISREFDPRACGWAFGMNLVDMKEWRKQNITEVYHSWQILNQDRQLWKLGTLPPGLITFWNRTYALDHTWHVLGLGYNPNINQKEIDRAAVIHYNGNLKPWLEIGIPKFRTYWTKYVDYEQAYLRECNINA